MRLHLFPYKIPAIIEGGSREKDVTSLLNSYKYLPKNASVRSHANFAAASLYLAADVSLWNAC